VAAQSAGVILMVRPLVWLCGCAGKKVTSIAAGHSHSAAIVDDGDLYMWGMKLHLDPHKFEVRPRMRSVEKAHRWHVH
jgi:alpha-tubulin suppressor-like RCC1 family protein